MNDWDKKIIVITNERDPNNVEDKMLNDEWMNGGKNWDVVNTAVDHELKGIVVPNLVKGKVSTDQPRILPQIPLTTPSTLS